MDSLIVARFCRLSTDASNSSKITVWLLGQTSRPTFLLILKGKIVADVKGANATLLSKFIEKYLPAAE